MNNSDPDEVVQRILDAFFKDLESIDFPKVRQICEELVKEGVFVEEPSLHFGFSIKRTDDEKKDPDFDKKFLKALRIET